MILEGGCGLQQEAGRPRRSRAIPGDVPGCARATVGHVTAFIAHGHSATGDCTTRASWAVGGETRLSTSGSLDYTTAPNAGGFFLGDYAGLTSSGTTFKTLFDMSQPIATTGR